MKVGILTLYWGSKNCGGLLQAYALCYFLNSIGIEAEQISFDSREANSIKPRISIKERIVFHVRKGDLHKVILNLIRNKIKCIRVDNSSFKMFEQAVPHSKKIYLNSTIETSVNNYDAFIVGSDQVWSWQFNYKEENETLNLKYKQALDVYFLQFVPSEKHKIAYAASIACPLIPDKLKSYYFDNIKRFSCVSLREELSVKLFPPSLQENISVALDPTMLLTAEDWSRALKLGGKTSSQGDYIFLYYLGPNKGDRVLIKKIKKTLGIKIIARPNLLEESYSNDVGLADYEDYKMGPREFVDYIKNASLVLTNSFHATVFSILFHVPFFVFKRCTEISMSSRLDSLLSDLGLSSRIQGYDVSIDTILNNSGIDWTYVDSILLKKRLLSQSFLLKALSFEPH